MSEQSLELLRRIRGRLADTARRMTLADLCFGIAVSLGVASAVWIISVALEAGFWFDTTIRTVLLSAILAGFAGLFGFYVLRPLLRLSGLTSPPAPELVARQVGERFPEIGDRLVNLLDLSEGRRSDAPDSLVDRAVHMLGGEIEPVHFEQIENFSRASRAVRLMAIPVASLLLFLAAAPETFIDASKRLFSPATTFQAPAPFQLIVEPGHLELARGSSMEIAIRANGEQQPRNVVLLLNNLDEKLVEEVRLSADSAGVFRHQIVNVRRSFQYRATAAPVMSEWFQTDVTEYPLIRAMQVTLQFPAYTRIPSQRLDANVGDVSALPGTSVHLALEIGGSEVEEAFIAFDDGTIRDLEVEGTGASGSFSLTREGHYRIIARDANGVQNQDPIAYAMNLITDASPTIAMVHPEPDSELPEELRTLLVARINDDFGFRDLRLHYRLAESRFGNPSDEFSTLDLPLQAPGQIDQEVRFDWGLTDATDLDPVPGDVIEFLLEIRDNDAYSGFKSARTPVHRLRLASLAEKYEEVDRQQNEMEAQMHEMMQSADQLRSQFDELRDELRRKQNADWEDERQLDQIQERQRRLEEQTEQLSRQMESMNRSMEQNNLLSDETLEMYREMQKVVEEINSPELMEALRNLQEALQQLNLQQMQEAVQDVQFNEEQYRQRLERALELFKKLRTQQSLEEAARRAEEIAKQQEHLEEQTRKLSEADLGEKEREGESDTAEERDSDQDPNDGDQDPNDGDRDPDESESDSSTADGDQSNQPSDNGSENPDENEGSRSGEESGSPESERPPSSQTSPERLATQQERSKEEMEQLQQLLEDIRRQMDELGKAPQQEMEQLMRNVEQQQLPQQMQENAEQLRRQEMQRAREGQQQMQQQLQQLQSQLSQMQSAMQGQQMEVNMAGLRRALSDILTLSQQQEELRGGVRSTTSESPSLREDARRQVDMSEGLATVIDSLRNLSENIPQMSREIQRQAGEAVREMSRATEAMTERSADQAAGHQTASMMHLNELALLLSDVMNQLMNSSGTGSGSTSMQQMIQQMQEMTGQQQQLNEQIQQFLNDMQGNRLSVQMQERLQQMAEQQEAIKRQLEQLRRNPESRGKLLGDLDKIGRQMEETIQELQQRQVDPKMIERQQQILQRLLDAQRSIHQRGQEDEREGHEGRDVLRESPADLPPEEAIERLRRDLLKALESGYAPDYEELIKRYFELLQNETLEREQP